MFPSPDTTAIAPRPVTPVSLIAAQLMALSAKASSLGYVDPAFNYALENLNRLAGGLDNYVEACTSEQSTALLALAESTRREDWASRYRQGQTAVELEQEMLSGHVEGQFLNMLVHATKARRILEIGLFTGYSALAMAQALPDDGQLLALEVDPFVADFAQKQFAQSGHGNKIRVEVGPAADSLRALSADTAFDFIFIDADKSGYIDYLHLIVQRSLLVNGGLICVDNTLMQGLPYASDHPSSNGHAIALFNKTVAEDPRFEQVLVPLRDGITLIRQV